MNDQCVDQGKGKRYNSNKYHRNENIIFNFGKLNFYYDSSRSY